ncbi:hypothetical protein [Acinetobacter sp. YH12153]|uniref:hypothetical protein n=1 Tax=Acinetobacter sp. YH12153 TaxID=2601133 RepID=UPI0015D17467|nr:hypothetical protein [Acinetobacter sp. YH12153]
MNKVKPQKPSRFSQFYLARLQLICIVVCSLVALVHKERMAWAYYAVSVVGFIIGLAILVFTEKQYRFSIAQPELTNRYFYARRTSIYRSFPTIYTLLFSILLMAFFVDKADYFAQMPYAYYLGLGSGVIASVLGLLELCVITRRHLNAKRKFTEVVGG